jgi:hypothetical protein
VERPNCGRTSSHSHYDPRREMSRARVVRRELEYGLGLMAGAGPSRPTTIPL